MQPNAFPSPWQRWEAWIAIALMVAFCTLNLYEASVLPFWYDEGWTLMQITGGLTAEGIQLPVGTVMESAQARALVEHPGAYSDIADTLYTRDTHPPAYFQAVWAWSQVFGTSLLGIRSFSVLCFTLAVGLVYLQARRLAGPAALIALALLLASPGAAYSAINARGYGMALLLVAVVLVGTMRAIETPRARVWPILAGGAAGLAAMTHYFAIIVLLPIGITVIVWCIRRRSWATLAWMLVAAAPGLCTAALVWLPQQMDARPNQMHGFSSWPAEMISLLRVFVNQFTLYKVDPLWLGVITTAIAAMLLAAIIVQARRGFHHPAVAIAFTGFVGYMVGLVALFWSTDKTLLHFSVPRYSVVMLPCLAVLVALLVPPSKRGTPHLVLAIVATVLAMGLIPRAQHAAFDNPWASAAAVEHSRQQLAEMPDDAIAVLTTKEAGRIGVTLHRLPDGFPLVYTPTPESFAAWITGADAYNSLYMRPLFWANKPGERPFPAPFYQAAEAAGFATEGMVWERTKPAEERR